MKKKISFMLLFLCLFLLGWAQGNMTQKKDKTENEKMHDLAKSWRESYFSGDPLHIGNNVQFLFDDYLVEDKYNLKRKMGVIEKYSGNPLTIAGDMPWELSSSDWNGVKLRHIVFDPEEKIYKGWYFTYRREPGIETGYNYSTLYAESKDGITWVKPKLSFFPYRGMKTNIVIHKEKGTAHLSHVFLDTSAKDVSKRYIALVKMIPPGENSRCIVRMYSPDGKKWTLDNDPVLFRGANDGSYSLVKDDGKNRWLIYRRPSTRALINGEDGFYADRNDKRRVSVTITENWKDWSYPRNIVIMDETDDTKVTQVGNKMDIDQIKVIKHENMFMGFLSLMDNLTISLPRHTHFMWSRDGFDWERLPDRPLFIENGAPGDWDAGSIYISSVLTNDDRFRVYYSGDNTPQGFYGQKSEKNIPGFGGTGLAFIQKNRFIGLQAGPEGGFLLTRQFILEGNTISINFKSSVQNPPPGHASLIKAELLQLSSGHHSASPCPGFSMEDFDPILSDDSDHYTLTWKGKKDLSELHEKPVYLRIYLKNSTLYTLQVSHHP
ncbi:MAG: hypothetical protein PHI28_07400 [Mangrovibacterium sp.]|nr:hypothetical protein [Mangrovibacterium sp.]